MKTKHRVSIAGLVILAIIIVAVLVLVAKHRAEAPVTTAGSSAASATTAVPASLVSVPATDVSVVHDSYLASVSGSYPQFSQAGADFNKKISDAVNGDVAEFTKDASADYQAHLAMDGDSFKKQFANGGYYYLDIKYSVVQSNANYVSVIIREEGFTGGAHPYHNLFTFNYDVKNQREMALAALFPNDPNYLKTVSDDARISLTSTLATAADESSLDDNMKGMLDDGTDPATPDNFNAFTFTDGSITVYFGEYQVAPYVYGEQQVTIGRQ